MTYPVEREKPGLVMGAMQRLMPKMTPGHVSLYRLFRGRWVDKSMGAPVLVLITTGRRSGKPRQVTVGHLRDGDDVVVAGTNGGLAPLPAWVLNLQADPHCKVQIGGDEFEGMAAFLEGAEWEQHWNRFVDAYSSYDKAHRWAGRPVPLIRLSLSPA